MTRPMIRVERDYLDRDYPRDTARALLPVSDERWVDAAYLFETDTPAVPVLTAAQADRLIAAALAEPEEHPTVSAMRDALAAATPRRDALDTWARARLDLHEEAIAYTQGQNMHDGEGGLLFDELDEEDVIFAARRYMLNADENDRPRGAILAALVLAGYTGVPREAVA